MPLKCLHVLLAVYSTALRHLLIPALHVYLQWEDLYLSTAISENPAVGPGKCAKCISDVQLSCFKLWFANNNIKIMYKEEVMLSVVVS